MSKFRRKLQSKQEIIISDLNTHLEHSPECVKPTGAGVVDIHHKSAFGKGTSGHKRRAKNVAGIEKQKTIKLKEIDHLIKKVAITERAKKNSNIFRKKKFASIDNPMEFWSKFSYFIQLMMKVIKD